MLRKWRISAFFARYGHVFCDLVRHVHIMIRLFLAYVFVRKIMTKKEHKCCVNGEIRHFSPDMDIANEPRSSCLYVISCHSLHMLLCENHGKKDQIFWDVAKCNTLRASKLPKYSLEPSNRRIIAKMAYFWPIFPPKGRVFAI